QFGNDWGQRMRYDVFVGQDENDPTGRMMAACERLQVIDAFYEDFLKGVKRGEIEGETLAAQLDDAVAKGRLDTEQAEQIRAFDALRYDAILTDDFSPEYLRNPLSDEGRSAEGLAPLRRAS